MPDPQSPCEPTTDETIETGLINNTVGKNETGESKRADPKHKEEYGGPKGMEPTRYGDWEKNGRCIDF